MKTPLTFVRRTALLGAALITPVWAFAQTVPDAGASKPKNTQIPVAKSDDTGAESDEMIILSPFTVSSTRDADTYKVDETLAGTRVRTKLSDIGSAITVVNSKFMSDIQANNAQSLLQYTTNTEVGGLRGNFGGMGNAATISESSRLLQPDTNTRVRGLTAADNTRNYFTSSIPWDGFNIDRVDMQRGPNSMLFGTGSPAGIINTSLNDAMFVNQVKLQNRIGQYGSVRDIADINYVLIPKQLAIRVVGLQDEEKYEQEYTFNRQKRIYAAIHYSPKLFDIEGAHTDIKINNENGDVRSRNPRTLTPIDGVTPWYTSLNKITVNPYLLHQSNNPLLADTTSDQYAYLYNANQGRIDWSNMVYSFADQSSSAYNVMQAGQVSTHYGIGQANNKDGSLPTSTSWPVTGKIASIGFSEPVGLNNYSMYASYKGLLGASLGEYRDKLMTDSSIFDFYKHTLDGPNSGQYQNWNGFNAEISQSFLDNRLAFDFAMYAEHYTYGGENYLSDSNYAINVDINTVNPYYVTDTTVSNAATKNPNLGRPYISTDGVYGNSRTKDQRLSSRGTVFGELRASDFTENEKVRKIVGRHQLTGVVSRDERKTSSVSWARWDASTDWLDAVGGSQSISGGDRNIDMVSYIGPSLLSTTSAQGLNLSGLSTVQQPGTSATVTYFDSHWKYSLTPGAANFVDPNAAYTLPDWVVKYGSTTATDWQSNQSQNIANYNGWKTSTFKVLNADQGDVDQLYFNGSKSRTVTSSKAFTWQGYMFDETFVPSFGWRTDEVTLMQRSPTSQANTSLINPYTYDAGPVIARDEQNSRTWSLVYKMPKSLKKYMPNGTDFSVFYNKSSNFEAQAIRKDYLGNTIPNATGKTTEYGFVVSALDGKVALKVNWYDTKVKDATLQGGSLGSHAYELALLPAWGVATAAQCYAGLTNTTIDHGTSVQDKPWFWDYAWAKGDGNYGARPRATSGAAYADDQAELASIKAFADNSMPQSFYDTYAMPVNVAAMQAGDWNNAVTQSGYVSSGGGSLQSTNGNTANGVAPSITVDTESKGVEFELYAQPLPSWNITVNASKDTSTNSNLSGTMLKIITMEKALYDSPAGDLHLWSAQGETFRAIFYRDIYGPYLNYLAQENTQVPELRPWHVNAITSYTFTSGFAKNITVGGAYHWAQGAILGYHLVENAKLADGSANPRYGFLDIDRPWRGSAESSFDLWVGYKYNVTRKLTWEIQLNLQSVGKRDHLVPISVEPNDGSWAEVRIANGQSWQLTNTIKF